MATRKPFHVYELASFLHGHAADEALLEGVARAALRISPALADRQLPAGRSVVRVPPGAGSPRGSGALARRHANLVRGVRPLPRRAALSPNKDELWLHLSLLEAAGDALRVARRRLIPSNLPPPARATSTSGSRAVYVAWFVARLRHHTISLGTTLTSGARWWWRTNRFGGQFWTFLAAAVFFDGALFIFFLLYNLYLVDLGFGMGVVGEINAARVREASPERFPAPGSRTASACAARSRSPWASPPRSRCCDRSSPRRLPLDRAGVRRRRGLRGVGRGDGAFDRGRGGGEAAPSAFSFFFAVMFATGIAGNWIAGHLPVLAARQSARAAVLRGALHGRALFRCGT